MSSAESELSAGSSQEDQVPLFDSFAFTTRLPGAEDREIPISLIESVTVEDGDPNKLVVYGGSEGIECFARGLDAVTFASVTVHYFPVIHMKSNSD